jgi:uncharacterized membrane protein YccC
VRVTRRARDWHAALRFALAIVVTDALVWWIFGQGTPVVMGSFAVICLLYFLDYPGSTRDRVVGYTAAAGIGAIAVAAGTLLTQPLVVAVISALAVTFAFSYARVLRGFVGRASVGLPGAFFLPVMADVPSTQLPSMVASWLIGSLVAIAAALLVLPRNDTGPIRHLLGGWLTEAADICAAQARGGGSPAAYADLQATTERIRACAQESSVSLGMVGGRQRALAEMVEGTQWGSAALAVVADAPSPQEGTIPQTLRLLDASAAAFTSAAAAVTNSRVTGPVPDLAAIREDDLDHLSTNTPAQLDQHYPARLVSILAMRMLWLAGISGGVRYPPPDLGSTADRTPIALLRLNLTIRSVWFMSAVRTAAATAACVLLVRELGLEHGLWVALAALTVTQVSFSARTAGTTAVHMALGAGAGIAVASLGVLLSLPHMAFVVLLPLLAALASLASHSGAFLAQLAYTPFALTNLAALQWTTDRGLEWERLADIGLGIAVAAGFTLLVFPYGLSRQLREQAEQALAATAAYLESRITEAMRPAAPVSQDLRADGIRALALLEATLAAAFVRPTLPLGAMVDGQGADNVSRDRLIGGDACAALADRARRGPGFTAVARAFASWWAAYEARTSRAPGQD